jgi:hypothetical protein
VSAIHHGIQLILRAAQACLEGSDLFLLRRARRFSRSKLAFQQGKSGLDLTELGLLDGHNLRFSAESRRTQDRGNEDDSCKTLHL